MNLAPICLGAVWGWSAVLLGRPARKLRSWVAIFSAIALSLTQLIRLDPRLESLWLSLVGIGIGAAGHLLFLKSLRARSHQP